MRRALAKTLMDLARKDSRLMLLTADLGFMVFEEFAQQFPDRFINVGVAEANLVGLGTGLAMSGYLPFLYSIATFASMRPYEQFRNGPVLHQLPVRMVGVGGGFEYGHAGITHYGLEDLGIARMQPNLTVIAPADAFQTIYALKSTYDLNGPIYYRIGKNDIEIVPTLNGRFRLGRIEILCEGRSLLMLSIGSISIEAWKAAEKLAATGIKATLGIVSSLNPAPVGDLQSLLPNFDLVVTVEEHYIQGGLGSLAAEISAEFGWKGRLLRCGVSRNPGGIAGSEAYMRDLHGLSADRLVYSIRKVLDEAHR